MPEGIPAAAMNRIERSQRELECLAAVLEAVDVAPRFDLVIEHAAREVDRIATDLASALGELRSGGVI